MNGKWKKHIPYQYISYRKTAGKSKIFFEQLSLIVNLCRLLPFCYSGRFEESSETAENAEFALTIRREYCIM